MTDKELADLVRLTGLVDRAEGDRAVLLGAFLNLADMARGDDGEDTMLRWREHGQQAMDAGPVVASQPAPPATALPGCVTGPTNARRLGIGTETVYVVVHHNAVEAEPRAVQRCRVSCTESALPHMRGEVRRLVARGIPEPANV